MTSSNVDSIKLYDYQIKDLTKINHAYRSGHRSIIYCLPTGGGKTVVFSYITKKMVEQGKKVLILTDRTELLNGSAKALVSFNVHPFLIKAGVVINKSYNVYVAMSQTLKRRISDLSTMEWVKSNFDLVIIDECHKEEFNTFFEQEAFGKSKVLGVTATPKRGVRQRKFLVDYTDLVLGLSVEELIFRGRLASPIYHYKDEAIDYTGVRIVQKDGQDEFNQEDIARMMRVSKIGSNLIQSWEEKCLGKKTIVFCAGSVNTIETCVLFNENGYKAKYLISSPTEEDGKRLHSEYYRDYSGNRESVLRDWDRGDFDILVNNEIFATGYDNPKIECVVLNKPILNENSYLQKVGRGSRVIEDKEEFHIIDMSDNVHRHGKWHLRRNYVLDPDYEESKKTGRKTCPKCGHIMMNFVMKCPAFDIMRGKVCGYEFFSAEKVSLPIELSTVSFRELSYDKILEMLHTMSIDQMFTLAEARGWREGWIYHNIKKIGRLQEYIDYKRNNQKL